MARTLGRRLARAFGRRPLWQRLTILALAPILAINLAVAFFGQSAVFPLSPFFLAEKCRALAQYAQHRPLCVFTGHPPLEPLIAAAEKRHGLPRGLLAALIEVESEGRPHRISPAGAMGPAQLMPGTAALLEVKDPFDSAEAVEGSARFLAQQLKRTRSVRLAVASYNAGPGAVSREVPRNGETEAYVAKVMRAYARRR